MWLWWRQAHTALGDHDEAAADLKAVLAEDASNRDARAELKKVREAQKKAYTKQKAVFGNMFQKVRALPRAGAGLGLGVGLRLGLGLGLGLRCLTLTLTLQRLS